MSRYRFSDADFIQAVKTSISISEVLQKLGLSAYGASYTGFHKRVKKLGIDTSHFLGQGHLKGKTHSFTKATPLEEILVANSEMGIGRRVKRRLVEAGLLKNECYDCGLKDVWNNKPIVLQIDHINGDH